MSIELSNDDLNALAILSAGLRPFREIGTSNMQISAVLTTLQIATRDGQRSASDLSKIASVSMSKIDRQIADAVDLGLVVKRSDDFDQRISRLWLTERGRGLVRSVGESMRQRAAVRLAA
jgi:DNA-binding MarR family transcriptional regulator